MSILLFTFFKSALKPGTVIGFFIFIFSIASLPILMGIIRSFFPFKQRRDIEKSKTTELSKVISDTVKEYLNESFLKQNDITARAKQASAHLINAGTILSELQKEMNDKNTALENLITDIEARKADAEHYARLASVNEKLAESLTKEIEKKVRNQIRQELEQKDKRNRVFSIILWIFTLIAGGVIGIAFQIWFL